MASDAGSSSSQLSGSSEFLESSKVSQSYFLSLMEDVEIELDDAQVLTRYRTSDTRTPSPAPSFIPLSPAESFASLPRSSSPPLTLTSISNSRRSVNLSAEQEAVLRLVKEGRSVFFTGSAGKCEAVWFVDVCHHSDDSSLDKV